MTSIQAFDSAKQNFQRVTLLEASAGTGKTYALARIFLRLVAEEGVEVGKILTVTLPVRQPKSYVTAFEVCWSKLTRL